MKRIYVALAFVIFSLLVAGAEFTAVKSATEKCLNKLDRAEVLLDLGKKNEARKLTFEAAEEFENSAQKCLYITYDHEMLERCSKSLFECAGSLEAEGEKIYRTKILGAKKQLLNIKNEELPNFQNVL